jgi:quercetin dioxygenase-like cupin family protein
LKITPLLETTTTWEGSPIRHPRGTAQITGLMVEIPAGGETGWHSHPVPSFGYILEGTLDVTLKNGRVKRLNAGEAVAEVIDTVHNGHVVGAQAVKLIVFYVGTENGALTTPAP